MNLLRPLAAVSVIATMVLTLLYNHRQGGKRNIHQRKQLETILETMPVGVVLLDAELRIVMANTAAQSLLSMLCEINAQGKVVQLGDSTMDAIVASPAPELRCRATKNGATYEIHLRPVGAQPERKEGWVLMFKDITNEGQILSQMQRQERLAALGQLTAGVAHDFKNIISVILLYSQQVAQAPDLPPSLREKLATVTGQTDYAADLIEQILDFSRGTAQKTQVVELTPLLKKTLRLLQRTLPKNIEMKLEHDANPYLVAADPTQLQQVLINLAINSRDAMPAGGRLAIKLARVTVERTGNNLAADLTPGEWVELTISDTGHGIDDDILPLIFEPFYSTKERGQGCGLGLVQVLNIVRRYSGVIRVASVVGKGTSFIIYLPYASISTAPSTFNDYGVTSVAGKDISAPYLGTTFCTNYPLVHKTHL